MNDAFVIGCCVAIAVFIMAMFALYQIYGGVYDSLANARVGTVYNFRYFQPVTGEYERYLAKIVDIRKLTNSELSRLNWGSNYRAYDKNFKRSNTLVTCEMSNGDYRQFYAERSDLCRRSELAGLLFKVGVAHLF